MSAGDRAPAFQSLILPEVLWRRRGCRLRGLDAEGPLRAGLLGSPLQVREGVKEKGRLHTRWGGQTVLCLAVVLSACLEGLRLLSWLPCDLRGVGLQGRWLGPWEAGVCGVNAGARGASPGHSRAPVQSVSAHPAGRESANNCSQIPRPPQCAGC